MYFYSISPTKHGDNVTKKSSCDMVGISSIALFNTGSVKLLAPQEPDDDSRHTENTESQAQRQAA